MLDLEIKSLEDLRRLRSAPSLTRNQHRLLFLELNDHINTVDWFTVGIMAPSPLVAINALDSIVRKLGWSDINCKNLIREKGPVFLKANQKTGEFNIRIEYGLGEGILLGCQHDDEQKCSDTLGPFPLNFFEV